MDLQISPVVAINRFWVAVTTFLIIGFLVCYMDGFQFDWNQEFRWIGAMLLSSAASTALIQFFPKALKAAIAMSAVIQFALMSLAMALLSLVAATISAPLEDSNIEALDQMLRYDWMSYAVFIANHPTINVILKAAYFSLYIQPFAIFIGLSAYSKMNRLAEFQIATLIAMLMTVAIFSVAPVTVAWANDHAITTARALDLNITDPHGSWVLRLNDIRSGRGRLVSIDVDSAIIGFPSFHAVCAVLNMFALFPFRKARLAIVSLNTVMIISAPIYGGHYIVDLLAGIGVALTSIAMSKKVYPVLATIRARSTDQHALCPI